MKKILLIGIPLLACCLQAAALLKLQTVILRSRHYYQHFQKSLVLGLFSDKNQAAKRGYGEQLATYLQKFGSEAVTATHEFGPAAFRDMNEQRGIAKTAGAGH
jgi:hypothetical protein